jgi:hypothetical protein
MPGAGGVGCPPTVKFCDVVDVEDGTAANILPFRRLLHGDGFPTNNWEPTRDEIVTRNVVTPSRDKSTKRTNRSSCIMSSTARTAKLNKAGETFHQRLEIKIRCANCCVKCNRYTEIVVALTQAVRIVGQYGIRPPQNQ